VAILSWRGLRVALLLLVGYWLLLFAATHLPVPKLPRFPHMDKVAHTVLFGGLSFLLCWAIPTRLERRWWNVRWAVALAIAYGAVDEISQAPVGRTPDIWDWVFDCVGALLGATAYLVARPVVQRWWTGRAQWLPETAPPTVVLPRPSQPAAAWDLDPADTDLERELAAQSHELLEIAATAAAASNQTANAQEAPADMPIQEGSLPSHARS
jgi:VanZ family protein